MPKVSRNTDPNPSKRRKTQPTPLNEAQAIVAGQIEAAISWYESDIEPQLEKATRYYMGEPFGNEEKGRSQVVSTDVRDATLATMPSLMRVFFGPENVVEYEGHGEEDEELAAQQTDYTNFVIRNDNDGFMVIYSAFKDALVRKLGIIKWWWDDAEKVEGQEFSGLTPEEAEALASDDEVANVEATPSESSEGMIDLRLEFRPKPGRARIDAVPPEEFIFSPSARDKKTAPLMGHVRDVPAAELVAMGVPVEVVDEHKGEGERMAHSDNLEAARRQDYGTGITNQVDEEDESMELVRFGEVYTRIDMKGEGEAPLMCIKTIGPNYKWWDHYVVDKVPYALYVPDPEPHTLLGLSLADYTMDIQEVKSMLERGVLDSLAQALMPATEVVTEHVNMKDVLNKEMGRVIRVRRPGMIREIATPFLGQAAIPVLDYQTQKMENRTGQSKAGMGLDADAFQSTTAAAVQATISGRQERIELIARIFAETGMRDLFQGVAELLARNQDRERVVRLRNSYVEVDPRSWDMSMDLRVNVALGNGLTEEKLAVLNSILIEQKENLKLGSPLVDFAGYRRTMQRILELTGEMNVDQFFLPFDEEAQAKWAEQQEANKKPSDVEIAANVELAKLQQKTQQEKMDGMIKATTAKLDDARQKQKMAQDFAIAQAQIEVDGGKAVMNTELQRELALLKQQADADAREFDASLKMFDEMGKQEQGG